jgi:hypothetical protein
MYHDGIDGYTPGNFFAGRILKLSQNYILKTCAEVQRVCRMCKKVAGYTTSGLEFIGCCAFMEHLNLALRLQSGEAQA